MIRGDLISWLSKEAKSYCSDKALGIASLERNSRMHDADISKIDQHVLRAVVCDFTNHLAYCQGMDLGLHAKDLRRELPISADGFPTDENGDVLGVLGEALK